MRTTRTTVQVAGFWTMAGASVLVGAFACDNGSSKSSSTAASHPAASPESNAATSPVSNTNAVVTKPADPLANIANRDTLVPDPNQTVIDPPKPTYLVTGFSTLVRTGPRGSMYEAVESTANVREVARDGDYFLITYPDPKGSSKTYAGWVYRDALAGEGATLTTGNTVRAAGKLACTHGESHLRTTQDFCAKTCKDDRGCDSSKGEICDGLGFSVNEKTNDVADARYCISSASANANSAHGSEHGSSPTLPVTK